MGKLARCRVGAVQRLAQLGDFGATGAVWLVLILYVLGVLANLAVNVIDIDRRGIELAARGGAICKPLIVELGLVAITIHAVQSLDFIPVSRSFGRRTGTGALTPAGIKRVKLKR